VCSDTRVTRMKKNSNGASSAPLRRKRSPASLASEFRYHDTTGDDLGLLEHPAANVEPGDVVMLRDGRGRSSRHGWRPAGSGHSRGCWRSRSRPPGRGDHGRRLSRTRTRLHRTGSIHRHHRHPGIPSRRARPRARRTTARSLRASPRTARQTGPDRLTRATSGKTMKLHGNHSRQAWAPSRLLVLVRHAHGVAVAVRLICDKTQAM